ncbi:helix-turn-helix domain-containing protein [Arundinibacter roseus]|uniref:Helix-turn-helix domain-containing protein n=1 Tax=Arundinibacter roseus TaxID=2070510 RepID=A0A4R4KHE2_9BACT|nr:helix-turn-helix domain-containing protein [Arundinibacter roseus]TDB67507.1 helix-turn-helix domain-containing protein [Arundinibacter roseus]
MSRKISWYLIDSEQEYSKALTRYQEIKYAENGTDEHKEKLLVAHLISSYEEKTSQLPEVDPIEMIKIRMEDFGYKPADLAKEFGDKGTISKILNYKRALSMTMVRRFSKLLHIPVDALIAEYELR